MNEVETGSATPSIDGLDARLARKSPREFLRTSRRASLVLAGIALAVALAMPLVLNGYQLTILSLGMAFGISAIGLTILLGWSGQFAFISTAFFGLGAYANAILRDQWGVSVEVGLLLALMVSFAIAALLGSMIAHLNRYFLSIATIAFMFVLDFVWRNATSFTGGVRGYTVPSTEFLVLGGSEVTTASGRFYASVVLAVAAIAFATWLSKTPLSRSMRVFRQSPDVTASLGISVRRVRISAIAIAGGLCGVGGAWFGQLEGRVFPQTFDLDQLVLDFVFVLVGGLGSIRGAMLAAVGLTVGRQFLRGYVGLYEILFGAALLLTVLFLPKGIYGQISARYRELREGVL